MSLSGGVWPGSVDLGPWPLMTGFLRFGEITFSELVGKNVLLTEGFLEIAEALKTVVPL